MPRNFVPFYFVPLKIVCFCRGIYYAKIYGGGEKLLLEKQKKMKV